MRLIRACVVAGAASLLIGVPAASAAPALTIKPKNREILYGGKSTKITGRLTGQSASGARIELQKSPYPYNGFVHHATKSASSNGSYSFTVKPDRNTRYRVHLVNTTTVSGVRAIYVDGVTKWKLKFKKGNRTIKVSFNFTFSPQLDTSLFVGVPVRWYFRTQGQKFHRVRSTKSRRLAQGVIGANLKYTYPNSVGKKKYFVSWCFQPKQSGDVGVGVPGKAFTACK
jgi:hypothetical protein